MKTDVTIKRQFYLETLATFVGELLAQPGLVLRVDEDGAEWCPDCLADRFPYRADDPTPFPHHPGCLVLRLEDMHRHVQQMEKSPE